MAKIKLAIDAGHGGADPGCVAQGAQEKNLTLLIADYMVPRAEELGSLLYASSDLAENSRNINYRVRFSG